MYPYFISRRGHRSFLATPAASSYVAENAAFDAMPSPDSPRLMMALTGPVFGIVSGLVLGLFAFVASKLVKAKVATR